MTAAAARDEPSDALLLTTWLTALALIPVAIALAPALWLIDTPWLGWTYGKSYQPFELLGFTGALALTAAASRLRGSSVPQAWPAAGFLLASCFFLGSVVEFSARSFDYYCYETAASLLNEGGNPYSGERASRFIYPPLFAIVMAQAQLAAGWLAGLTPGTAPPDRASDILFFGFRSLQLIAGICVYPLLYLLARRAGAPALASAAVSLALVLVDTPLTRTLKHNQVNLLILDLALLVCLFPGRAAAAGLLLALGTHIKLYPALLIVPLWATGYRKTVAWWAAGMLLPLAAAPMRELWPLYAEAMRAPPGGAFRDNSVSSLVFNSARLAGLDAWARTAAAAAAALWTIGVGVTLVRRIRTARPWPFHDAGATWLAAALLVSPIAWEHQYVLALPLIALRLTSTAVPAWSAVVAAGLILLPPTFDVFPLSYHRLCALAWLVFESRSLSAPVTGPR